MHRYLKDYSRSDEDGLSSSSHLDSTVHTAFPVADDQMEEELPAAGTVFSDRFLIRFLLNISLSSYRRLCRCPCGQ